MARRRHCPDLHRLVRASSALVAFAATLALVLAATAVTVHAQNAPSEPLWRELRNGGHVMLMRHALAPGVGDPDDFTLGDCSTQRLLSDEGRKQAVRLGREISSRGIPFARVYASEWCRAMETAELLGLARVEPLPLINSFFQNPEAAERQTRELARFVSEEPQEGNILLVTHQANIEALTGRYLAEGEIIVLEPRGGGFEILGKLRH